MKKLQLFILFLMYCFSTVNAQLTLEGSNEYGRIFDITYDQTTPGKLYAATLGNHIVVSENNGNTWEVLYTYPQAGTIIKDLKQLPGNKLAFTINNPNAYNSNGIYILNIASLSITQNYQIPIPDDATSSFISAYDVYATNTNIAIVQQYYEVGFAFKAKVYYTNDGGISWNEIYDNTEDYSIFPCNVAISPDNPQKLFMPRIGGLDPAHIGGLLISEDSGVTWEEKLPGIDFKPIAFNPQNPDIILLGTTVGSQTQNLFKSLDGGETWSTVNETWTQNVTDAIITIKYNPHNSNNIIILAEKDIVKTTDGLQTLEFYHHPTGVNNPEGNNNYYYGTNASFNPFTAGEIFISANYFPLFSANGGTTVTRVKQPYFASLDFAGYVAASNQSHLYYGVQSGFVHKDMSTQTQTPAFVISLGGFTSWSAKFFCDPQVAGRTYNFVSGMWGSALNISNDHGITNIQTPVSFPFMEAIATQPGNPNVIWCSASDYMGTSSLFELNISDPANLLQQPITLPEENFLTALSFNPVNPQEIYIALGTHLYKSTTGGSSWTLVSQGLEVLQNGTDKIFQIVHNPLVATEMTLATSQGIFISQDAGTTWQHATTFPNEGVHLIGYSTQSAGQLVAVTYDTEFTNFTLRYSSDSGQNWLEVPAGDLAHITCYAAALKFGVNNATVYLNTTDLGVVSYTIDFAQLSTPEISLSDNFFSIYPNPANDHISIQLNNESLSNASIYSVTGQQVMETTDNNINVSSLQSGVYFVTITTISGKTAKQKFIKL